MHAAAKSRCPLKGTCHSGTMPNRRAVHGDGILARPRTCDRCSQATEVDDDFVVLKILPQSRPKSKDALHLFKLRVPDSTHQEVVAHMQAKTLHCGKEVAEHAWAHRGEPRNRSERSGRTSSQSVAEGVSTRGNANNTRELIDLWAEVQELHAKFRQQTYRVAGEMHDVWLAEDEIDQTLLAVLLLPSLDEPLKLSESQSMKAAMRCEYGAPTPQRVVELLHRLAALQEPRQDHLRVVSCTFHGSCVEEHGRPLSAWGQTQMGNQACP